MLEVEEAELNSVIYQYLDLKGYDETAKRFELECSKLSRPFPTNEQKAIFDERIKQIKNKFLEYFDAGKFFEFFADWDTAISAEIRLYSGDSQKLEFYLRIHFAILPLRDDTTKRVGSVDIHTPMQQYKHYLETRGAQLSQTSEFLPYYALPFVPKPQDHPTFEQFFTDKWIVELRNRLDVFLNSAIKKSLTPQIYEMAHSNASGVRKATEEIQTLKESLIQCSKRLEYKTQKYEKLAGECRSIFQMLIKLIEALEGSVHGKVVNLDELTVACAHIYPNIMRQTRNDGRPATAADIIRRTIQQTLVDTGGKDTEAKVLLLDYAALKSDLMYAHLGSKLLILQALRWQLTQSLSLAQRQSVLSAYVSSDFLGFGSVPNLKGVILGMLHSEESIAAQHTVARLLSVMSTLAAGRNYVRQACPQLIHILQSVVNYIMLSLANGSVKQDDVLLEICVSVLQKLSLRNDLQLMMIEIGVIEWLVSLLEEREPLSDIGVVHATATLMNLCLRPTARRTCVYIAERMLRLLSGMLSSSNRELIRFVNGTLFSLMVEPNIRQIARKVGLGQMLQCLKQERRPNEDIRQWDILLDRLESENSITEPDDTSCDSDDDDNDDDANDFDEMECEFDSGDPVLAGDGELQGEELLKQTYMKPMRTNLTEANNNLSSYFSGNVLSPGNQLPDTPRPPTSFTERSNQGNRQRMVNNVILTRPSTPRQSAQGLHIDTEATDVLSKIVGRKVPLVEAAQTPPNQNRPKQRTGFDEYTVAFSTRPKIPRTPQHSGTGLRPLTEFSTPQSGDNGHYEAGADVPATVPRRGSTKQRSALTAAKGTAVAQSPLAGCSPASSSSSSPILYRKENIINRKY